MFEILFLFGLLGLGLGTLWEYLSSLAAFPTLLVGFITLPLLCWADYLASLHRFELESLNDNRPPVPPERFYWGLRRRRFHRALCWFTPAAAIGWTLAVRFPADSSLGAVSLTGWASGAAAILATARLTAWSIIYVRASHWFDRMAPWAVGASRRALYRLSDNPDFLGPADARDKRAEEKTIY